MAEWQLFDAGTVPEYATAEWYAERDAAPHLEQEGHRERLWLTAQMVGRAADRGAANIVDLGAGDGGLLQAVRELGHHDLPAWGYDLQPTNVAAAAARGVDVTFLDFNVDDPEWADVAVAAEVIEHLVDPHGFVRRIHDAGVPYLVASSPYTETPEAHYGYHLWAWDLPGYKAMIEAAGWRVLFQETAWISQVLLAERA